ncbi:meiosis-specific kinetochore protein [Arvicola amphibius]|uniref:meiosis-specific kinetochore protein n=1 Tax=Arvicola amphibius TaxID=1047088 RepID=UPI0018E36902|nr:meiosis-specific kinetochore protein [Arvicola amphibius]
MWPRRVYTRKKRDDERLNLTPKPDLAVPGKTEVPPGLKGKGKEQGLRKITEKEELNRFRGSSSQLPSQLSITGGESLQENIPGQETPDEKITPLSSVTKDFKIDSCSSSSELVSGMTSEYDVSSCPLSCSDTDSYTKSTEENSFPSPELFRGSDYLNCEHPRLQEYKSCKNSTLLDTSNAVAVEKVAQLADLSAILSSSPENYEECHRKIEMTLEAPHISSEPKYTPNLASVVENATSEVIFAEKTGPPTTKKAKKKPEKKSEDSGLQVQAKLSSGCPDSKAPFSHYSSALESIAVKDLLLPQPLEPVSKKSSTSPDKQNKALLTSTPSSDTADFVIDLSPVQNVSFEELFPNVSNYVNSSEIVPVSSWQESSSNEFPSYAPEICCIIRASPGTRRMRSKEAAVKKRYSPPTDVPPDIIMKTNGRT